MNQFNLAYIIDDDPISIYCTKKLLSISDFSKDLVVYHSGLEALEILRNKLSNGEETPEVILLDINMPIMDGWQFLDEFLQIPNHEKVKIFMVSSSIDPSDIRKAKKYRHLDYLIKPITKVQINDILDHIA